MEQASLGAGRELLARVHGTTSPAQGHDLGGGAAAGIEAVAQVSSSGKERYAVWAIGDAAGNTPQDAFAPTGCLGPAARGVARDGSLVWANPR